MTAIGSAVAAPCGGGNRKRQLHSPQSSNRQLGARAGIGSADRVRRRSQGNARDSMVRNWEETSPQLSGHGSDLDGESKVLQTVEEAQNVLAFGAVVKVVCAQVLGGASP